MLIKRFYKDWYRPDLMAVLVGGDIDPTEAEKMIKTHFEKLKNPATEKRALMLRRLLARSRKDWWYR